MRVLVVEDERSVATGMKRALVAEGYRVDVAHDGETGLGLATTGHYDVVLLDVMLPKVNGFEVCRALRNDGYRVPVIMLTAKTGQWDIVEGLDLGADDYLTKPFSMAVLLAHVRARTRGPHAAGSVFVHGDLRLEPAVRRCWCGDREVELTGREARVLATLFERAGQVVTKPDLLEQVWGDRFDGDPNVVEVYVARLRRKMRMSDIETIRGVGYRLRAPSTVGSAR